MAPQSLANTPKVGWEPRSVVLKAGMLNGNMLILKAVVVHMHCFSLPIKGAAKYEANPEFLDPQGIQSGALKF